MADTITRLQLENASRDADDLGKFVNDPAASSPFITRTGAVVKNLAKISEEIWVTGDSINTYAKAQADAAAGYAALAGSASGVLNFNTIALLTADTALSYTAGPGLILVAADNVVTAEGVRYVVIASGGSGQQITTAGGVKLKLGEPEVADKVANYTVLKTDVGKVISMDASGGSKTITLPSAADAGDGFKLMLRKSDSSANTVIIDGSGAELINGAATYTLRLPNQALAIICDGTAWRIMSSGEIFESGSTATGDYIKFANGFMIITFIKDPTALVTASAAGSVFMSAGISPGNFPVPFISAPSVQHSGMPGGANGWTMCAVKASATAWGTYRTVATASDANTGGVIHLTATGRWV